MSRVPIWTTRRRVADLRRIWMLTNRVIPFVVLDHLPWSGDQPSMTLARRQSTCSRDATV